MFDKIYVCLDGSPLAERIMPLAQGIAKAKDARLVLLRVVERAKDIPAAESYMRERAGRFDAGVKFLVADDPAGAIVDELLLDPRALPAITTHGRTAWAEALLGSVALRVIRGARRPVLLHRPLANHAQAPGKIATVIAAIDGGEFAEEILPFAAELVKSLGARLVLIQALPQAIEQLPIPGEPKGDILESSYLHRTAAKIRNEYAIEADWDVLHGEAGNAICRYVQGMPGTLLAMTSHARGGIKRAFLGSVAAACTRSAGTPMLLYWPGD